MILLDTHIWIWWVSQSPQLTPTLTQHIQQQQQNRLGVSIISCWEVAKLVEINDSDGLFQLPAPGFPDVAWLA